MNTHALLFVYGSLRRGSGHPMGEWLAQRAEWRGRAFVAGLLYRVSWYPALVPGAGRVSGDLYAIPLSLLAELDAYEDIRQQPEDEYRREPGPVALEDGTGCEAWIYWYVQPVQQLQLLPEGDWLLHAGAGS